MPTATDAFILEHWFDRGRWRGEVTLAHPEAELYARPPQALGPWVIPGLVNAHSHAFQRAMAGRAEHRGDGEDSFWTWRERMYALARDLSPEQLYAIACQAYAEMLCAGYTQVCEFHYVHLDPDGRPYTPIGAMCDALIAAAAEVGIGLTLLPTLYLRGGFDDRPLHAGQRRFGLGVDAYLRLVDELRRQEHRLLRIGLCFHSLRAVPIATLVEVLRSGLADSGPIHLHIAEQPAEVADCLDRHRRRPIEYLLEHVALDPRWALVHATHASAAELAAVAQSGAVVVLCPSTEANLGDGLFDLSTYVAAGGCFAIGSDSHIGIAANEELRWLEYGQRLKHRRRNVAPPAGESGSTGRWLVHAALTGGARAAGGHWLGVDDDPRGRLDLVVLDERAPIHAGATLEQVLDGWIFFGHHLGVREVWVDGRQRVSEGRHLDQDRIAARYRRSLGRRSG